MSHRWNIPCDAPIQIESRTDQGQMTERLRRVTQLLSTDGDLLGEHAQMVTEAEHVFEHVDGFVEVFRVVDAGSGERLDQPEGAHAERAFAAADA